jgi:hypothetical protein
MCTVAICPSVHHTLFRNMVCITGQNKDSIPITEIKSCQILVGTSCAGTGLDCGSVSDVLVVGLPFGVETLMQWSGRCRGNGTITIFVPRRQLAERTELAGNVLRSWVVCNMYMSHKNSTVYVTCMCHIYMSHTYVTCVLVICHIWYMCI